MQRFPGVISAASGNKANAAAVATLVHTSVNLTYVTGIEVKASGATAALPVLVTLSGILGGTLTWVFTFPAGALVEAAPLVMTFNPPLQSVDANTDIVLTLPASGSGGTNASVVLHGFVGSQRYSVSSTTQVLPSDIANLFAWYRFNTGITITGSGVSQWNDQTVNANHLLQGTDAARPSNASGQITFDGVGQFLSVASFVINQPLTICLFAKSVSWTGNSYFWSGGANSGFFMGPSPRIDIYAGTAVSGASDLAVGTYGAISIIFDGASSSIGINKLPRITGNAGTSGNIINCLGGYNSASNFSNITAKDMAIYSRALNATELGQVSDYQNGL